MREYILTNPHGERYSILYTASDALVVTATGDVLPISRASAYDLVGYAISHASDGYTVTVQE